MHPLLLFQPLNTSLSPPNQPVTAPASSAGVHCQTVLPSSQQHHRSPASLDLQMNQESRLQDASQLPAQQCQSFPQLQHQDARNRKKVSSSNLIDLLKATIKFPQHRAVDFLNISSFASDEIDSKNVNLSLFIFGSLKHLLFLSDGTLPSVSKSEFNNRLQNLINMMEIVCLGSSNEDLMI